MVEIQSCQSTSLSEYRCSSTATAPGNRLGAERDIGYSAERAGMHMADGPVGVTASEFHLLDRHLGAPRRFAMP